MEGYRKLSHGNHCEIWAADAIRTSIETAPESDRARAQTILRHIMENGHAGLPPDQFKWEGRFPSGMAGVEQQAVYVVKAYQVRIYGGFVGSNPRRFVCVEGAVKKRDRADQAQLKRVAKALGALNEQYG